MKLFMLLLGCRPKGRNTEQHDILFGIGNSLKEIIPDIMAFWPDGGKIHIDAWREVNEVDGFSIKVLANKDETGSLQKPNQLFFINLGGYKPGEFEEYHYKMLAVAEGKSAAITQARQTAFYKHTGFKGATSHIDDKYGIDVDDIHEIKDILPKNTRELYTIELTASEKRLDKDVLHLGYTVLSKLED